MRLPSLRRIGRLGALAIAGFVFAAADARAEEAASPRLLSTAVAFRAGVFDTGYSYFGGGFGDLYAVRTLEGRFEWKGLLGEASLFSPSKFAFGLGEGATVTLRVGYSGERFAVLAGPTMQVNPTGRPMFQPLPSVHARYSFGDWGVRGGIFDLDGLAPAHVGLEWNGFGLSYVAPVGALAHARIRAFGRGHLLAQAMVVQLFNTRQVFFTLGAEVDLGRNPVPGWSDRKEATR